MKKSFKTLLAMLLLMVGTATSWAEWSSYELVLNKAGLLTAEEISSKEEVTFGVALDESGKAVRVAATDENAVAVITGKYHSDHGMNPFSMKAKVNGPVNITAGTCSYGTCQVKVNGSPVGDAVVGDSKTMCWKNNVENIATGKYEGEAGEITITTGCYTPYIKIEAVKAPAPENTKFDKVATTFTWAVGNESEATVSDDVNGAVSDSKVTVGTDLTVTSTSSTYTMAKEGTVGPYCTYQPSTGNPGVVTTDMIEYTIQVKKGLTFTPTSFVFDAVKAGTDNAFFSWSYTIDGKEIEVKKYSDPKTQIRRDNDANPSAPITHTEAVTAEGGQKVTLRFYISDVANNKKMSIGNIKINGIIDGEVAQRSFKPFKIDFRSDPYTVVAPEAGLPEGVEVAGGSYHGTQHGYQGNVKITVPVDGPVKFTFGGCRYNNGAKVKDANGNVLATIDVKSADCDNSFGNYTKYVTWTYNSETAQTLTIEGGDYFHFLFAEPCELIPMRTVTYYDVDGKTIIGKEEVEGGSALVYAYGAENVTVASDSKFRGWFNSTQASAVKVAEGTSVQENLPLYAKVTPVEVAKVGSIFSYPLNSNSFYIEDHECVTSTGKFHDTQHGFEFGANQSISVNVAGNAVLTFGKCQYGNASTIVVTDAEGNQIGETMEIPVEMGNDGAAASVSYNGPATTLNITLTNGGYIHNLTVYNVEKTPAKNAAGYYEIAPNDAASLQLVLAALQDGDKVYLPNGTYDFGEKVLTTISAKNVSIIGESMDGTIIRNCPPKENEGIGTTATLLNTSDGLYMQDLTLKNDLDYYATGAAGRAVCLQDQGKNTICKNVKMLSYQDTYYSNKASNFYWEDSEIHGTVDYLCGDGDVVYNRCKFVNESREKGKKAGSDVLAAPYTSASCQWGYVFLDCAIESKCNDFTFARSWGGESKAQVIRMQVLDNSLNAARFTKAGMNIAAYKFKEFGVTDASGKVTTPSSNVITFTHKDGNKTYETVLTAEEAAQYTVANIYGSWAPDQIAAQVEDVKEGTVFLVDGKITTIAPVSGTVRIANARGGFGPEVTVVVPEEAKEYTVKAVVEADGKSKTFENQTVKVVWAEESVDVILPAAELTGWSMPEQAIYGLGITGTEEACTFATSTDATVSFVKDGVVKVAKNITLAGGIAEEKLTLVVTAEVEGEGTFTVTYSGDVPTAANAVSAAAAIADGKYVQNGKLVIVKGNAKYNAVGQEVK